MQKHKTYILIAFILGIVFSLAYQVNAISVLFPLDGATGTSTAPSSGDLLIGNSSGVYDVLTPLDLSFGTFADMIATFDSSGNLVASSTPTAANYLATSTTATSTFQGDFDVFGQICFDTISCISAFTDITAQDAIAETPSGTINGVNDTFTLSEVPTDDDNVLIQVNGQAQRNGVTVTISGTTVTFASGSIPRTGSTVFAHYNKTSSVFAPGLNNTVVIKTTDFTLTNNDGTVLMNNTSTATTTLPTAVGITGQIYNIKKINSAAANVVIDADGSETIDGELTETIVTQYDSVQIISDGANWNII